MSVESVKAFYTRLAKDEAFRSQLENTTSMDERRKLLQDAGYNFTEEEFEAATAQRLESESPNSELSELSEEEMVAVIGGAVNNLFISPPVQAMYGVVRPDEVDYWDYKPIIRPLYGAITDA